MVIVIQMSLNFHGLQSRIKSLHKKTSPHEETNLYFEIVDIKWMIDPWEIKDRYLHNQNFKPHFDQYRYIYRANAQKYYLRRFYS
ncbi:hypothetical protein ACSBR1_016927 [Camellia fascicularis]